MVSFAEKRLADGFQDFGVFRATGIDYGRATGKLGAMSNVLRVPTHKFKYNMAPLLAQAQAGTQVIVTNHGEDAFQIVPCDHPGPPPVSKTPLDPELYRGIDTDEPAFKSWEDDESAP